MYYQKLIEDLTQLIEKRRDQGATQYREMVLVDLVKSGIYTPSLKVAADYGGPRSDQE